MALVDHVAKEPQSDRWTYIRTELCSVDHLESNHLHHHHEY
jgi:hypothetical protein